MGERGPKKGCAYGAASVTQVLQGTDFPMSKRDIINRYGNREIQWTKDNPQKLKDVLSCIPDETFNSPADLEHAISLCR